MNNNINNIIHEMLSVFKLHVLQYLGFRLYNLCSDFLGIAKKEKNHGIGTRMNFTLIYP